MDAKHHYARAAAGPVARMELLEQRQLLAATWDEAVPQFVEGGHLEIGGRDLPDYVEIYSDDTHLLVNWNGDYRKYVKSSVNTIAVHTGDGNDVIIIGKIGIGVYVEAGNDDDLIVGGDGPDYLLGCPGDDTIYGGDGADYIDGGRGHDLIFGGAGNDTIFGDDGDDTIFGEEGNDQIHGGLHNDLIDGGPGADALNGDAGWNTVTYASRRERLWLSLDGRANDGAKGEGDLLLNFSVIIGGFGHDVIIGDDNPNVLNGGPGNDLIRGRGGNDTIIGGRGRDSLYGDDGNDMIYAMDKHKDLIVGGKGLDRAQCDWTDDRREIQRLFKMPKKPAKAAKQ